MTRMRRGEFLGMPAAFWVATVLFVFGIVRVVVWINQPEGIKRGADIAQVAVCRLARTC